MEIDITRVKSLNEPELPCDAETAKRLSSESIIKLVSEEPVKWIRYLVAVQTYCGELEQIGYQHETAQDLRMTQFIQLEQDRNTYKDQMHVLQGELVSAQKIAMDWMKASNQADNTPKEDRRRSAKHPDPDKYGGKKEDLDIFIAQLRVKLTINSDHWTSETQKICYAASRLEGDAMLYVLPHLKSDDTTDYKSVGELIETLQKAFGDPDKKTTAQRELQNMKQKNQDFASFAATFQRWAPASGFDNNSLISYMTNSISMELRQAMINHAIPEKLSDYITLLQELDNRIQALPTVTLRVPNRRFNTNRNTTYTPVAHTPSTMITPITPFIVPADSISNIGDPMDLSNTRRGPLSDMERQRRRALGLCSYCGRSSHGGWECPCVQML